MNKFIFKQHCTELLDEWPQELEIEGNGKVNPNIEVLWESFKGKLSEAARRGHLEKKERSIKGKENRFKLHLFFDKELQYLSKQRKRLRKQLRKEADNPEIVKEYRKMKNREARRYRYLKIEQEKRLHEDLMLKIMKDLRLYWRKLKETMKWEEKEGLPDRIKNQEGNLVTNPDGLMKVWETAFKNLSNGYSQAIDQGFMIKIKEENHDIFVRPKIEEKDIIDEDNYELNKDIEFEEVVEVIGKLKRGKAVGTDGLPGDLLVHGGEAVWKCVWRIFKRVFEFQQVPREWRKGLIFPIHKKGDRLDTNNYRGITLLNITTKVFTTFLNNRIIRFCEKKKSISSGASWF